MECKEALRKEGYMFKQLQKLSDAQFTKMRIEDDFMMQLQSMCISMTLHCSRGLVRSVSKTHFMFIDLDN